MRCAISGTLEVRSKFAQGTVRVRYGCGTGAVRYFNFFMTDTVCSCCDLAFVPTNNVVLTVLDQSQTSYWTPDLFATDSTELN